MKVSRRIFLKSGGVAMIGMSTIPAFLQRAVAATPMPNKKKLIVALPARRRRRLEHRRAVRRRELLPHSPDHRDSAAAATAPKARRSISTASSACIRASRRSGRSSTTGNWPSFTPPDRPTRRARISTPRISWSPARPA